MVKNNKLETIDELIDDLESTCKKLDKDTDDLDSASKKLDKEDASQDSSKDVSKNRDVVIELAEDGEIEKSVAYVKKASQKVIDKLYSEYERKRMQKANEFLTGLLISKFSSTLGGLDAIEDPEVLTDELIKDELLKRDVYAVVESISPYIPMLGILSGGVTTAKHIYKHKKKPIVKKKSDEDKNDQKPI